MKSRFRKKLSPQTRKMILRGELPQKLRAIVRFALANPEQIATTLEEKKLKISRWISKERLTAILELDREELEELTEMKFVSYIEVGGRLSASKSASQTQETGTLKAAQAKDKALPENVFPSKKDDTVK